MCFRGSVVRITLSLCLCASLTLAAAPPAYGFQLFGTLSNQQEYELGRQAAAQVERQARLVNDRSVNSYVQNLGARLARNSGRTDVPYR